MAKDAGRFFSFPMDPAGAPEGEDLVVFHAIGGFIAEGRFAAAYDPATFQAALPPLAQDCLWLNPPHAGLVFAPLAVLPYGLLKAFWLALTAAAMAGVAMLVGRSASNARSIAHVFSPASLASVFSLQLGAFFAAGLFYALQVAETRPKTTGAILSLLTIKPQYGLLVPVFLASIGAWRAVLWAGAFTLFLIAASISAFGVEPWTAFFQAAGGTHFEHGVEPHLGGVAFAQELAKQGASPTGVVIGALASVGAAAALIWFAARRLEREYAMGLLLILAVYVSPSAWIYDWPLVSTGLLLLAKDSNWPLHLKVTAPLAWIAPLAALYFYFLGPPAASVSTLSLTALLISLGVWLAPIARRKPSLDSKRPALG